MEVLLFSGYIRNLNALKLELGLSAEADENNTLEKEILVRGFERWGRDLCSHLYGAFSFAVLDSNTDTLYCARDQFGISTFFYHLTENGKLLFSEDIREIARHKDYKRVLDQQALRIYLMLGYCAGTDTLFEGVKKLPAGHWLIFKDGKISVEGYYSLNYDPDYSRSEEEWTDEIENTAREIIKEDQSDFRFDKAEGFLSSGVDSSYLLALSDISSVCTIGYDDSNVDESGLARHTAEILGRKFSKHIVSPKLYFDTVPRVVSAFGLPLADMSSVVFRLGCEEAAKRTKMCFSGEGADEFFAGYRIYQNADKLAFDNGPLHFGCYGIMTQKCVEDILLCKLPQFSCDYLVHKIYKETENCEHLSRLLAIDVSLFLEASIMFGLTRSSAECGLQIRTPFADRRMFELSCKIPSSLKLRNGVGKYIFRSASQKKLPYDIAFRKKTSFSVPTDMWMRRDDIKEMMEKTLFGEASKKMFCQNMLYSYWSNFQNGNDELRFIIFTIYVFIIWYEQWF